MRILIVDDDELARTMLEDILADVGTCEMAVDGEVALEKFIRARADNTPFELICLDYIMPGLDGQQVLRKIRSIEAEDSGSAVVNVPVIMVSSMSDLEHIMMSFDERCEAYMIKPVNRLQMKEQLSQLGLDV